MISTGNQYLWAKYRNQHNIGHSEQHRITAQCAEIVRAAEDSMISPLEFDSIEFKE